MGLHNHEGLLQVLQATRAEWAVREKSKRKATREGEDTAAPPAPAEAPPVVQIGPTLETTPPEGLAFQLQADSHVDDKRKNDSLDYKKMLSPIRSKLQAGPTETDLLRLDELISDLLRPAFEGLVKNHRLVLAPSAIYATPQRFAYVTQSAMGNALVGPFLVVWPDLDAVRTWTLRTVWLLWNWYAVNLLACAVIDNGTGSAPLYVIANELRATPWTILGHHEELSRNVQLLRVIKTRVTNLYPWIRRVYDYQASLDERNQAGWMNVDMPASTWVYRTLCLMLWHTGEGRRVLEFWDDWGPVVNTKALRSDTPLDKRWCRKQKHAVAEEKLQLIHNLVMRRTKEHIQEENRKGLKTLFRRADLPKQERPKKTRTVKVRGRDPERSAGAARSRTRACVCRSVHHEEGHASCPCPYWGSGPGVCWYCGDNHSLRGCPEYKAYCDNGRHRRFLEEEHSASGDTRPFETVYSKSLQFIPAKTRTVSAKPPPTPARTVTMPTSPEDSRVVTMVDGGKRRRPDGKGGRRSRGKKPRGKKQRQESAFVQTDGVLPADAARIVYSTPTPDIGYPPPGPAFEATPRDSVDYRQAPTRKRVLEAAEEPPQQRRKGNYRGNNAKDTRSDEQMRTAHGDGAPQPAEWDPARGKWDPWHRYRTENVNRWAKQRERKAREAGDSTADGARQPKMAVRTRAINTTERMGHRYKVAVEFRGAPGHGYVENTQGDTGAFTSCLTEESGRLLDPELSTLEKVPDDVVVVGAGGTQLSPLGSLNIGVALKGTINGRWYRSEFQRVCALVFRNGELHQNLLGADAMEALNLELSAPPLGTEKPTGLDRTTDFR